MNIPRPSFLYRMTCLASLCAGLAATMSAATYHIDYAKGSDTADGLSPTSAWKHAPGDKSATGRPEAITLKAGDTILFKGGVAYFGAIGITTSGRPDAPITYDGNMAGAFGKGRAILDGGQLVTGWRKVASVDEVKGNPRWQHLFYADIDVDVTGNTRHNLIVAHRFAKPENRAPWQRVMLSDGDRSILPIAQLPKPKDDFFPDLPSDFFVSPAKLDARKAEGVTLLTDTARLTSPNPRAYEGVLLGFHAGNNQTFFADIKAYDPAKHQLSLPYFDQNVYRSTNYALYNSPAFIENPGEWSITPLGDGRSRIHILPLRLADGVPANVAYPVHETGVSVTGGASHLRIQGFLIQRYSGGQGGVFVARNNPRAANISILDNEIRFLSGEAGIGVSHVNDLVVAKNNIHHCPGWTAGIFLDRATRFQTLDNRLDKNSGSGIRLYEGLQGVIARNTVLDHYGIHSSGMNLYEGCADIVVEDNFIENVITINRNAERLTLRNNVVDAQNRSAVTLTFWASGRTRGTTIREIQILNNTFVNTDRSLNWSNGLFGQPSSKFSPPEGIIVRGNIMDRPYGQMNGVFENNIYLRAPEADFTGTSNQVVSDPKILFRDPENRDFRRRPGGPLPDSGANLPPPPTIK